MSEAQYIDFPVDSTESSRRSSLGRSHPYLTHKSDPGKTYIGPRGSFHNELESHLYHNGTVPDYSVQGQGRLVPLGPTSDKFRFEHYDSPNPVDQKPIEDSLKSVFPQYSFKGREEPGAEWRLGGLPPSNVQYADFPVDPNETDRFTSGSHPYLIHQGDPGTVYVGPKDSFHVELQNHLENENMVGSMGRTYGQGRILPTDNKNQFRLKHYDLGHPVDNESIKNHMKENFPDYTFNDEEPEAEWRLGSVGDDELDPNTKRYWDESLDAFDEPHRVQWVPTEAVSPFREYDRRPGGENDMNHNWDSLKEHIRKNGIGNPLTIDYNQAESAGHLSEGNHRLQIAEDLGIPHVPVQVFRSKRTSPTSVKTPFFPEDSWSDRFDPSGYHVPEGMLPKHIGLPTVPAPERRTPPDPEEHTGSWDFPKVTGSKVQNHFETHDDNWHLGAIGDEPQNPEIVHVPREDLEYPDMQRMLAGRRPFIYNGDKNQVRVGPSGSYHVQLEPDFYNAHTRKMTGTVENENIDNADSPVKSVKSHNPDIPGHVINHMQNHFGVGQEDSPDDSWHLGATAVLPDTRIKPPKIVDIPWENLNRPNARPYIKGRRPFVYDRSSNEVRVGPYGAYHSQLDPRFRFGLGMINNQNIEDPNSPVKSVKSEGSQIPKRVLDHLQNHFGVGEAPEENWHLGSVWLQGDDPHPDPPSVVSIPQDFLETSQEGPGPFLMGRRPFVYNHDRNEVRIGPYGAYHDQVDPSLTGQGAILNRDIKDENSPMSRVESYSNTLPPTVVNHLENHFGIPSSKDPESEWRLGAAPDWTEENVGPHPVLDPSCSLAWASRSPFLIDYPNKTIYHGDKGMYHSDMDIPYESDANNRNADHCGWISYDDEGSPTEVDGWSNSPEQEEARSHVKKNLGMTDAPSEEWHLGSAFSQKSLHHNPYTGLLCDCAWGSHSPKERNTRQAASAEMNKLLKQNQKVFRTEDGQKYLSVLSSLIERFPEAESLVPWIASQYKNGGIKLDHGNERSGDKLIYEPEHEGIPPDIKYLIPRWAQWMNARQNPLRRGKNIMSMSVEDLNRSSDDLIRDIQEKQAKANWLEENGETGEVVHRFDKGDSIQTHPDGDPEPIDPKYHNWTVRKLNNEEDCDAEGEALGHCLGENNQPYKKAISDGKMDAYSLRDQSGHPKASWHLNPDDKSLAHIQGSSGYPKQSYRDLVSHFHRENGIDDAEGGSGEEHELEEQDGAWVMNGADNINDYREHHHPGPGYPGWFNIGLDQASDADRIGEDGGVDIDPREPDWSSIARQLAFRNRSSEEESDFFNSVLGNKDFPEHKNNFGNELKNYHKEFLGYDGVDPSAIERTRGLMDRWEEAKGKAHDSSGLFHPPKYRPESDSWVHDHSEKTPVPVPAQEDPDLDLGDAGLEPAFAKVSKGIGEDWKKGLDAIVSGAKRYLKNPWVLKS